MTAQVQRNKSDLMAAVILGIAAETCAGQFASTSAIKFHQSRVHGGLVNVSKPTLRSSVQMYEVARSHEALAWYPSIWMATTSLDSAWTPKRLNFARCLWPDLVWILADQHYKTLTSETDQHSGLVVCATVTGVQNKALIRIARSQSSILSHWSDFQARDSGSGGT